MNTENQPLKIELKDNSNTFLKFRSTQLGGSYRSM